MGSDLFQHFLQSPDAVDGKSHHRQNVVSLLSSYHHVNFAVWVLPFSIISLYLLIDPTYNMQVIFFLFWLSGVNMHFFFSKQAISYHCQSKIFTISNSEAYSAKTDNFLFRHRGKIQHFPRRIIDVYASISHFAVCMFPCNQTRSSSSH